MTFMPFPSYKLVSYERMPLTLMTLEDWMIVNVTGPDCKKYLQGQITADISHIEEHQHMLAAHCNIKGRMWGTIRLFRYNDGFSFIERRSLHNVHLNELKKYALFSKVDFTINKKVIILGLAGFEAKTALTEIFNELPTEEKQVIVDNNVTLLWLKYPTERFLILTDIRIAEYLTRKLKDKAQFNNSQQWLALNIQGGIPIIDTTNSNRFIPLAANLHALGGVSFKKGCYLGQEVIARIKFRGINKHAMWYLSGDSKYTPLAGEDVKLKIGNNWRRVGTILAAVQLDDGCLHVQVIMSNNIYINSIFSVYDNTNILHIKALPYSIRESL